MQYLADFLHSLVGVLIAALWVIPVGYALVAIAATLLNRWELRRIRSIRGPH